MKVVLTLQCAVQHNEWGEYCARQGSQPCKLMGFCCDCVYIELGRRGLVVVRTALARG